MGVKLKFLMNPLLLSSNVFTSIERTPWAGELIYNLYKKDLFTNLSQRKIGESWEFSCSFNKPSYVLNINKPLAELISSYPKEILGFNFETSEILVKLINADYPLSFQVHPKDDDVNLKDNECGKPESWLVLDVTQNAGIYLGFSEKLTKQQFITILQTKDPNKIQKIFGFIPVQKEDYFEIEPGIPHAIGPGCVILEPQRVLFNKEGKTYRIWDWERKYDSKGNLDYFAGKPRELHIDEALNIIDFELSYMPDLLNKVKKTAKKYIYSSGTVKEYPQNDYYQLFVFDIQKDTNILLENIDAYIICLILGGFGTIEGKAKNPIMVQKGQSLLLSNFGMPYKLVVKKEIYFVIVIPSKSKLHWEIL